MNEPPSGGCQIIALQLASLWNGLATLATMMPD
jgi:hypothetical protein